MTTTIIYTILSVIVVSLVSLVGLFVLAFKTTFCNKAMTYLVSFSAGALLGDVFIHLLPELAEKQQLNFRTSLCILGSILIFFVLERYIHWHHHHGTGQIEEHQNHPLILINLIGDGIHNLIDGMIIAGAFLLDVRLGLATTLAVMLHEIPQEIGDFGILVYGGLTKTKALFYNFLSAITSILGAVFALFFGTSEITISILIALGIGSFIYLAAADLIPETHKEKEYLWPHLLTFLSGIGIMFLLLLVM
jgi:zinc and cadmium transporter